ncbi:MAG TPA: zf-HC2 domain-containing protein [Actinomycetota bacterium]|nr:zf-HC2 domain-containing protein [Actinomycetota bacterium]
MDCDRVRAALSARMDGDRLSPQTTEAVDRHVAGCRGCSAFDRGAWWLRERARLEPAPRVPDLVVAIMTAVREEVRPGDVVLVGPADVRASAPGRRPLTSRLGPLAAALVVGLLAGSLVSGGPWRSPPVSSMASASEVARAVAEAAGRLDAYQATFVITEHPSPNAPAREFSMHLWFQAPERFRLDVTALTRDAGMDGGRSDLHMVIDGSRWALTAPSSCPAGTCPARTTVTRNRIPFTSFTPADLVVPVSTLGDPSRIRVEGRGTVLGHPAIRVRLPFEDARPLFPFLSLGGRWRPFFPQDGVELWLDSATWSPLRYEVFPAPGRAREEWALRFGLPREPPREPIFEVRATSLSRRDPSPGTFAMPEAPRTVDQGARPATMGQLRRALGFEPIVPQHLGGLQLYRAVLPPSPGDRTPPQAVITYSQGLSWLQMGETAMRTDGPYGPVGPQAEEVSLPGGGVGYYEPATEGQGRRLSIHSADAELYLETNLPRDRLLRIAGSLPIVGVSMPARWTVRRSAQGVRGRVSPRDAAARLSFPLVLPSSVALPPGFTFASTELVKIGAVIGVTAYYQQVSIDPGIGPIRVHEEPSGSLPPASSALQSRVWVRGHIGRWTPRRGRLEWIEDGVYRSIDAPGLALSALLRMADAMRPYDPSSRTSGRATSLPPLTVGAP